MPDDEKSLSDYLMPGDGEPWSLETTQQSIFDLLNKYSVKDSKNIQLIAKNIAKLAGDTKVEKELEKQLRHDVKTAESESRANATIQKILKDNNKQRSKEARDISDKQAKSILNQFKGERGALGMINAASKTLGSVSKAAGSAVTGIANFDGNITKLGGALLGGGILGSLFGLISNEIDTYREMIDLGQSFGGSLLNMRKQATQYGLTLKMMTDVTKKHSKLMAGEGIDSVLKNQREVRNLTKRFSNFGMKVEQINEFNADYLERAQLSGVLDQLSDEQRRMGVANYLRQLTALSKITGMSREQIAEEIKKGEQNINVQTALMSMDKETRLAFKESVNIMDEAFVNLPTEFKNAMARQTAIFATTGGVAQEDIVRRIMMLSQDAGDALMNMMQSAKDRDQKGVAKNAVLLKEAIKNMEGDDRLAILALLGGDAAAQTLVRTWGALNQEGGTLSDRFDALSTLTDEEMTSAEKRDKRFDETTEKFLGAQEQLISAITTLQEAMITKLAKPFQDAMEKIEEIFKDINVGDLMKKLETGITGIGTAITFVTDNFYTLAAALAGLVALKWAAQFALFVRSMKVGSAILKGGGLAAAGGGALATGGAAAGHPLRQQLAKQGGRLANAGKMVARGSGILGGALVAKDVYDLAESYRKGEDFKKEDLGAVGGAAAGAAAGAAIGVWFGGVGAIPGALIGMAVGNWLGEVVGERADIDDARKEAEKARATVPGIATPVTGAGTSTSVLNKQMEDRWDNFLKQQTEESSSSVGLVKDEILASLLERIKELEEKQLRVLESMAGSSAVTADAARRGQNPGITSGTSP